MANTVKSNRQIWGTDFPSGGEWDAGCSQQGRWTVRLEACRLYPGGKLFSVVYRVFADRSEVVLGQFPATEQGESDAKTFALAALDARRIS
ncbi:MAG: hypothetical protein QMD04_14670 [Anaerolineales bacterium]|nr:hypothetical protein [Anaerolineales bacterium]